MKRLILYKDLDGNTMVLICTDQAFYRSVFETEPKVEVIDEIGIEGEMEAWPTNRALSADF